jgi:tetratricopeptide (TPR) repeat protein
MRHHILGSIAYAMNELQQCRAYQTANRSLLSEHAAVFKDEPNLELSVTSNLAHINMRLGQYEEALEGLKRIKRLPLQMTEAPNADLELKIFSMTANLEISILCRTGDFAKAIDRLPAIAESIKRYGERLSGIRRAGIRFQAAWIHFANGDMESAATWCEDLLNERGVEAHEEVFALGRVLRLLIQLETGKYELLRYEVRNVERFLKGHGRYHHFEQAMVRYVKACVAEPAATTRQAAQLTRALQALEHDPLEGAIFDHFDPIAYALSRSGNGTMKEIVVRRAAEATEKGRSASSSKRSAA